MKRNRYTNLHGMQVMRMQQIMTASMAVAAMISAVHFWPTSGWLGIAGSLSWLLGYAGILALEFLAMVTVNKSDPAPRASWQEMFRAWCSETCIAAQVFSWRQPFRANEVQDQLHGEHLLGQRGVVFIHGMICNRGFWTPWLKRLEGKVGLQRQHAFTAISLEPVFASIDAYVEQIERAVVDITKASGLPPILVCHSMGGLAARAWLKQQNGSDRVHHVVTIGTPHHGTWLARFAQGHSGRQMRQGSAWLTTLNGLSTNNDSDQPSEKTKGQADAALFTCWYSNCDNIVFPASTAMLPGADNRFIRGAAHLQLAFLPEVMKTTLDMILLHPTADETRREM